MTDPRGIMSETPYKIGSGNRSRQLAVFRPDGGAVLLFDSMSGREAQAVADLLSEASGLGRRAGLEEARSVIAALKAALNGIEDAAQYEISQGSGAVEWEEVAAVAASALAAAEKAGY